MTFRRKRRAHSLAAQWIDLGFAVPQVLAHRMMRMALAESLPSRRDRSEFYLMGAEKITAFYESWAGMSSEMLRATLEAWLSPAPTAWLPFPLNRHLPRAAAELQHAALGVLGRGIAPFHRRAVANAKRLNQGR